MKYQKTFPMNHHNTRLNYKTELFIDVTLNKFTNRTVLKIKKAPFLELSNFMLVLQDQNLKELEVVRSLLFRH